MKKASAKKTKAKKAAVTSPRKTAPKTKPARKQAAKSGGSRAATRAAKGKTLKMKAPLPAPSTGQKIEALAEAAIPPKSPVAKAAEIKTQTTLTIQKIPPTAVVKIKPAVSAGPVRVDLPPEAGYSVVVDGHFKALHAAETAAFAEAKALKTRFPFLRIEIFDAAKKTRSNVG